MNNQIKYKTVNGIFYIDSINGVISIEEGSVNDISKLLIDVSDKLREFKKNRTKTKKRLNNIDNIIEP